MDRRIIVGYDGRDQALDAVVLGRLLAEAIRARLALVIALPYDVSGVGEDRYEQALEEDAQRLLGPARPHLEGVRFDTLVFGGESPPRLLHDVAEGEAADMIVLGSTHRGPVGRLLLGGVAERLLAASPCAVAVAPRAFAAREEPAIGSIGVGFDGSEESAHALELACDLAGRMEARLVLYAIVEPPGLTSPDAAWMAISALGGEEWESEGGRGHELEQALSAALEKLPAGVKGSGSLMAGDPGNLLVERSADVDLLIVGSRGYGPVGRVLLGDVAGRVMRSAACPVVAVPRGAASG